MMKSLRNTVYYYYPETFDTYINMGIGLPRYDDGQLYNAVVKKRSVDDYRKPLGKTTNNLIADYRQYEVGFLDVTTEVITANTMVEKFTSQVDEEGHLQILLSEIIYHIKRVMTYQ